MICTEIRNFTQLVQAGVGILNRYRSANFKIPAHSLKFMICTEIRNFTQLVQAGVGILNRYRSANFKIHALEKACECSDVRYTADGEIVNCVCMVIINSIIIYRQVLIHLLIATEAEDRMVPCAVHYTLLPIV